MSCASFQEGPAKVTVEGLTFVEVDGWQLHVERAGEEGDWLLLLHGYSSTLLEWSAVVPRLCERRRCILVDLPGFGWSDKKEGDYSPPHVAEMVASVMDRVGAPRADVVAHSWGASVALSLAHAYPEKVGRLVLVGAWVYYDQLPSFILWSRVPVLGEALFTLFFAEQPEMRYEQVYFAADEHVKEEEIEVMERGLEWPGVKRAALQAARDQRLEELEPFYPEVTHETLLVWGEEDRVSFPFYARRLASDLPHARLVFVPHCGHVPFVESPSLFADLVLEFLGQEVAR